MLSKIFSELKQLKGCKHTCLKLFWENAETVYIEQLEDGDFRVYDSYETVNTLRNCPDTYLPPHEFGFDRIRTICESYCLQLLDLYPTEYETGAEQPLAIVGHAADEDVAETAADLADAIDQILSECEEAKNQRTTR